MAILKQTWYVWWYIPEAGTGLGGKSGGSGMPSASCCWNVSGVIFS